MKGVGIELSHPLAGQLKKQSHFQCEPRQWYKFRHPVTWHWGYTQASYHWILGCNQDVGVSGDQAAAHQNTGKSSETNESPHNDTSSNSLSLGYTSIVSTQRCNFWHPITGINWYSIMGIHGTLSRGYTVTARLVYQEIRQLLITIKAAAFQPRNLSSASKPSAIYINLVNVLE